MSAEEIMEILRGLDPGSVAAAGASYTAAANALDALAERIARHARTLSEHWDGTAADAALASLRHSREQARSAAARTRRTGAALTWLGNEVLPMFRSLPDPAGQPYQPDAHAVASRYLAALDDYLAVAAKALPLCQTASVAALLSGAGFESATSPTSACSLLLTKPSGVIRAQVLGDSPPVCSMPASGLPPDQCSSTGPFPAPPTRRAATLAPSAAAHL